MFIKVGDAHINPETITHFVMEGDVLTIYFVGGGSLILDAADAKIFTAALSRGGRY